LTYLSHQDVLYELHLRLSVFLWYIVTFRLFDYSLNDGNKQLGRNIWHFSFVLGTDIFQ
jgi:hypothetical protein